MKKTITLRLDTELVAATRRCAVLENRTLTNFIETLLKLRIETPSDGPSALLPAETGPTVGAAADRRVAEGRAALPRSRRQGAD